MRIMCRVLEVSVSGFYAVAKASEKLQGTRRWQVDRERIGEIFQTHRGVYGSPRIHAALQDEGIHVGRKRVVRLMQQIRLFAHCRIHRVVTTKANPQAKVAENVLNREFEAEQPHPKWAADVTSIATASGWL